MIRSRAVGIAAIRRRRLALGLLASCLAACASGGADAPAGHTASTAAAEPDGAALFRYACATCHYGRGALLGVEPLPLLLSESLRYGDAAPVMSAVIREGTASTMMPAFGGVLSDAEIDALVAYIRSERARAGAGSGAGGSGSGS